MLHHLLLLRLLEPRVPDAKLTAVHLRRFPGLSAQHFAVPQVFEGHSILESHCLRTHLEM